MQKYDYKARKQFTPGKLKLLELPEASGRGWLSQPQSERTLVCRRGGREAWHGAHHETSHRHCFLFECFK